MFTRRAVGIVGGAGFLGLALAEYLLVCRPELQILLFDIKIPSEWLASHPTVRFEALDVTKRDTLAGRFRGVDVLFHKAGILGGPKSARVEHCQSYLAVNAVGAYNVLEAAQACGVSKIVFDSSEQVFGVTGEPERLREDDPVWPLNYYGVSKAFAEDLCRLFASDGLHVVVLRYPRVRAAWSRDLIDSFIRKVLKEETIALKNSGEETFDWVDVEDVCRAAELALDRAIPYGLFHIGSGESVSLIGLVRLVEEVTGRSASIRFEPDTVRPFDADRYRLEIRAAGEALGFRPRVTLRRMVERSFDWIAREELVEGTVA